MVRELLGVRLINQGKQIMKIQFKKTVLSFVFIFAFILALKSQVIVNSTNGYSAEITINPSSLFIYGGNNCDYGYNYDVNFDYSIKIIGSNIPTHLYTLQGTIETSEGSMFFNLPKKDDVGSSRSNGRVWTSKTDCKTATLETTKIQVIKIQIEGPGIPSQIIIYKPNTSLPIQLISFEAKQQNEAVVLSWITATEVNNDYFTVERSIDGVQFDFVANIKGAGNSNQIQNYSYFDRFNNEDGVYYRIKQTDYDGKFSYSDVVYVAKSVQKSELVSVYPNPSETNLITFSATSPELYNLAILTLSGQVLQTQELTSSQISLPELTKGMYILQFNNRISGEIQNVKYVQK